VRTCLNFFELKDLLAIGQVSNMYDIAQTMLTGRENRPDMTQGTFRVLIFESVSSVLVAEKDPQRRWNPEQDHPGARYLSSDCGCASVSMQGI
jgi:hypothetical protein